MILGPVYVVFKKLISLISAIMLLIVGADEKNLPFTPETISHTSSLPVWWKCEKGHSWQTQLRSRSTTLTKCPKCRDAELNKSRKLKVKELSKRLKTE